jgi:hypothetical protein
MDGGGLAREAEAGGRNLFKLNLKFIFKKYFQILNLKQRLLI